MRGIWTQASRPRLSRPHSPNSVDAFTSTLVRKTTTRPPRRRPKIAEHVFTVLLTPVLAAALFVDTSWKAKQRRDWDDKINTINDEINQLKEREQRLRSSLQLRNVHHGLCQQRRSYNTAAYATKEFDDEIEGDFDIPVWDFEGLRDSTASAEQDRSGIKEAVSAPEFSSDQLTNFKRYHRLNAITLALRMLLHIHMGPNAFYLLTTPDPVDVAALEDSDKDGLPTDTDQLVQMLAATRKQMRSVYDPPMLYKASRYMQAQARQGTLPQTIQSLTRDYDEGNMSLARLVEGYATAIIRSTDVPSISVYLMLIRSLSKTGGSMSLTYHATAAMKMSTLPLSEPALVAILMQMSKACDSRSLNHLLRFITNSDNPYNLVHPWEKVHINGIDLAVPTTLNQSLLVALVYAALRCEQPDRAEAWLTLLQEADYGGKFKDDLFRAFLNYYSYHGNWVEGKKWLKRCVDHASSIANESIDRLGRVIYRMLDLCVRCRKLPEYTAILDAAVDSGIGPPSMGFGPSDPRRSHPRTRSIILEWEALPLPEGSSDSPVLSKAKSFQYACRYLIEELTGKEQSRKRPQDIDDDLVLMASTASHPHQRYAVRRPRQEDQALSVGSSAEEFKVLQTKVAQQETLISEMKARFDLAILRQMSRDKAAQEWTQNWFERVNNQLQRANEEESIRDERFGRQITMMEEANKQAFVELHHKLAEQEALIHQLKQKVPSASITPSVEPVPGAEEPQAFKIKKIIKSFPADDGTEDGPSCRRVSVGQNPPRHPDDDRNV